MALANNPPLILADEPTGELDSINAERIVTMFKQLKNEFENTLFLVSYKPSVMADASRVIHLKDGRIIEDDNYE